MNSFAGRILPTLRSSRFWAAIVAISIVARFCLPFWDAQTSDYVYFLRPWVDFIRDNGYWRALDTGFSNYMPLYTYLLVAVSYLPIGSLMAVKLLSMVIDYVMAAMLGALVARCIGGRYATAAGWAAAAVVVCLPTVVLNSIYWGQCDSLYTTFIVASLYFLVSRRRSWSMAMLGLALATKLQAAMLLPLYYILLLRGSLRWRDVATVAIAFVATLIPAWIIGRPFGELISIYPSQTAEDDLLTYCLPNIYFYFTDFHSPLARTILTMAVAIAALIVGYIAARSERLVIDSKNIVAIAYLCAVVVPLVLPGMHERYLYMADVLAVAFAFCFPRRWWLAVPVAAISLYAYLSYLKGWSSPIADATAFVVYLTTASLLIYFISKQHKTRSTYV